MMRRTAETLTRSMRRVNKTAELIVSSRVLLNENRQPLIDWKTKFPSHLVTAIGEAEGENRYPREVGRVDRHLPASANGSRIVIG